MKKDGISIYNITILTIMLILSILIILKFDEVDNREESIEFIEEECDNYIFIPKDAERWIIKTNKNIENKTICNLKVKEWKNGR